MKCRIPGSKEGIFPSNERQLQRHRNSPKHILVWHGQNILYMQVLPLLAPQVSQ